MDGNHFNGYMRLGERLDYIRQFLVPDHIMSKLHIDFISFLMT